jgi:fructose-specific phosphotransferase system IIC component
VASVLRLVAVGLLLLGVVLFVLAYAANQQHEGGLWQWFVGGGSFLLGLLLLVFSSTIARFLTRDYE